MRTLALCIVFLTPSTACGGSAPTEATDPAPVAVAPVVDAGVPAEAATVDVTPLVEAGLTAEAEAPSVADATPDAGESDAGTPAVTSGCELLTPTYCAEDAGAAYWCNWAPDEAAPVPEAGGCTLAMTANPSPTIRVSYWCCPAWCLPYEEVDAPPGSGSLPDPVPGRTCHAETSGNLIYWCCVSE